MTNALLLTIAILLLTIAHPGLLIIACVSLQDGRDWDISETWLAGSIQGEVRPYPAWNVPSRDLPSWNVSSYHHPQAATPRLYLPSHHKCCSAGVEKG